MTKIGITERGDASIDYAWTGKLDSVDMAVLITKNITKRFAGTVLDLHRAGRRLVVHATCTGWGGTYMEPNVPPYETQLASLRRLIDEGFPMRQCVLRVDPIIPTPEGLERLRSVLDAAHDLGLLPGIRVRVSIVDEYRHVKDRLAASGHDAIYNRLRKYPTPDEIMAVKYVLGDYSCVRFETCAEPMLSMANVFHVGCVSRADLDLFGLTTDVTETNMQNRSGCLCLKGKTELLSNKKRCPNQCMYCYWCG